MDANQVLGATAIESDDQILVGQQGWARRNATFITAGVGAATSIVVAFILARLRIISVSFLNKNRKYALLLMVTAAAFFTPPDIISQLLLAGPMWLLYELSVVVTWIFGPKPIKEETEQ